MPVAFPYGDGYVGQLARPAGDGPFPGILVAHEADGLGNNVRRRADMLSGLGYVALCIDLYGGGAVYDGAAARAHMEPLLADRRELRRRARIGLDALAALPFVDTDRIAAVGYCFGGATVLELARDGALLRGVASFHGLLETPLPAAGSIAARVAAFHGHRDPLIPPAQVVAFQAEMEAVGADWQLTVFGRARHAFSIPGVGVHPDGVMSHDPAADQASWAALQVFLAESLAD